MRKIYCNGPILTMEEPIYTEAVLTDDGKILATGTFQQLKAMAPDAEKADLCGNTMMPAFIDAHSHFSQVANSFLQVSLANTKNFHEIVQRIRDFIEKNSVPPGQWVIASGYDHNALQEKRHPNANLLDSFFPDHPVVLQHQSGHMGVFNTPALCLLHVTEVTPAPEGGTIEINGSGLTGYMEESAFIFYLKKIPLPSADRFLEAFEKAQKLYISNGITTMQEGMMVKEMIPLYQALLKAKLLKTDLIGYMDVSAFEAYQEALGNYLGARKEHFKIGGFKIFLDGSPQGRTAWLRRPYESEKSYCGYGTMENGQVDHALQLSWEKKLQILAHCNGDAAAAQYIDRIDYMEKLHHDFRNLRPVMIHAQLLGTDQLPQVKQLGIIPSFFVAHVYHWGDIHVKNLGTVRAEKISPAASAMREGILFTFHQDAPVIQPDMLETVWAATTRRTREGRLLGAEERIPVLDALKAVTIQAAYQYFEENEKGSIRTGKVADFVILDQNPLAVEPEKIRSIRILSTIKSDIPLFVR